MAHSVETEGYGVCIQIEHEIQYLIAHQMFKCR